MVASAIPGKVYNYMASGRPINSFCKPGPLADLIRKYYVASSVDEDTSEIRGRLLADWADMHLNSKSIYQLDPETIREFDTHNVTCKMPSVLNNLSVEELSQDTFLLLAHFVSWNLS